MKASVLLAAVLTAIGVAVSAPDAAHAQEEVCGEVGDSSDSVSAVFDYENGRAVPAPTVLIGDREFDSSAFSAAALGAFELAHAADAEVCVDTSDSVPSGTDVDVELCGPPNRGSFSVGAPVADDIGLQIDGEFVLIDSSVFGFRLDEIGAMDIPNIAGALHLASEACVSMSVRGAADDEQVDASVTTTGCYGVLLRTADVFQLQDQETLALVGFGETADSEVPADLEAGEVAGLRVTGYRGIGGAVEVERVDVPGCAGVVEPMPLPRPVSAPMAPPVSGPAGPPPKIEVPISAPVGADAADAVPTALVVLLLVVLTIGVVSFVAFRTERP